MPSNYNFTENGVVYNFDNVFVPAEIFRQPALWTWGSNSAGQLGINNITNRSTPVTTFTGGNNWKQVSCQGNSIAAIKTDGTLWVWGAGANGQLGTNDATQRSTPTTTFVGGSNWQQASCGFQFKAAIKTDGTLWTWGYNINGQLGTNDSTYRSTPVTTFTGGNNWKQVSTAQDHISAIKTDGTLWIWGSSSTGQLGNAQTTNRFTPVTTFLGGTNWRQVSCSGYHTAAIKTDGTLWTWGGSLVTNRGQLGVNDTINRSTPVTTFAGGNNWKSVECGGYHTVAIKTDGTLWTWGFDNAGQLGINGNLAPRSTPVTTFAGGNNWKSISADTFTTAIKTDGTLWTWGSNLFGQLGTNDASNRFTPTTTFLGGSNWNYVTAGSNTTEAIQYKPDP